MSPYREQATTLKDNPNVYLHYFRCVVTRVNSASWGRSGGGSLWTWITQLSVVKQLGSGSWGGSGDFEGQVCCQAWKRPPAQQGTSGTETSVLPFRITKAAKQMKKIIKTDKTVMRFEGRVSSTARVGIPHRVGGKEPTALLGRQSSEKRTRKRVSWG